MEKYWSNPVRDLKVGRYTLNGTTYGGDLDCDKGETEACSGDDMDEQVTESAAVPESPVEAQDPIGHLETEIVSIQGENKTATVYKTSKAVIKFESTFTIWQYVSIKVTGILDADSNQDIMSQVVDGKCDDCPAVASVNDIIAAGPSTPTSDDKAAKLLMQSLPSNATGAGPIDDAAKNKAIETVLEQYPKFQEPAIPKTVQTDKSKTPQAGAKDSCKRKRRAAFAQRLRV
ncbi:hypothetical protein MGU_08719 [Metarhizium guizhouense ARSEF 977]|uniref:Uncharacterized protein n=1 Tax=Metarhizium guizhouense (strain ARSEF 977) TaxID=1276136 RepID=A0A0B4H2V6_METGA|nr:hypothetical protein MGU_08719 [Metarhizium guizhouense ARSEF 977]